MYTSSPDTLSVKVINCQNNTYGLEFHYGKFENPLVFINITPNETHINSLCDYFAKNSISEYHIEEVLNDYKSEPAAFIASISK